MAESGNTTLRWRAHPLVDDFPKSLVLIGIILGVLVVVKISFAHEGYVVLAGVLLVLALGKYFFPTRYELSDTGVRTTFLGHGYSRPWRVYSSVYNCRGGVHLSPFREPSRLDTFRGSFLLCRRNKKEVLAFVREKIRGEASREVGEANECA
jgi:hypothetical protein